MNDSESHEHRENPQSTAEQPRQAKGAGVNRKTTDAHNGEGTHSKRYTSLAPHHLELIKKSAISEDVRWVTKFQPRGAIIALAAPGTMTLSGDLETGFATVLNVLQDLADGTALEVGNN